MNIKIKKFSFTFLFLTLLISLFSLFFLVSSKESVHAQQTSDVQIVTKSITLSAPIPIGDDGKQIENSNKSYFFTYMVKMYRFVLGIAGIAAIIELIIAGFQITLSGDDTSGVENGKKRVIQTLEGVAILTCSAIVLNTINPVAFNFDENVKILESEIMKIESSASNQEFNASNPSYSSGTTSSNTSTWVSKKLSSHPHINDIIKLGGNGKIPTDRLQKLSINHVNGSAQYMYKPAAEAFNAFYEYAKSQGKAFTIYQGFRSYSDQEWFYACYKSGGATGLPGRPCNGQKNLAAVPGTSMHGWGLAVDLASYNYSWIKANAGKFNFRETVSGEPWHWEWWGPNNNPVSMTNNSGNQNNPSTTSNNNSKNYANTSSGQWTDKVTNEISYIINSSNSGDNIFIGIGGSGLKLNHSKPWVKALNDATLKNRNIKHVFAVTGPYSVYGNTSQDTKLVDSLYSEISKVKTANSKIIITIHSSGGYIARTLITKLKDTEKKNTYYFNLDGVGPNNNNVKYIGITGKTSFNGNIKNPDMTITPPKGCTTGWCYHFSVISSAATNNNEYNAYTNATASNVIYEYMSKLNW